MRCTVPLVPESDPDVSIVDVPTLRVVAQGASVEEALQAAREAASLAVAGCVEDGEEPPIAPSPPLVAAVGSDLPSGVGAVA